MSRIRLAALAVLLLTLALASACAAQAQGGANYGQAPASSHPDREVLVPASGQHPDREIKSYPDSPRNNQTYWNEIGGNIDLVLFPLNPGESPASKGKMWRGRPQLCLYGFRGGLLESHPGYAQAKAWAEKIAAGQFGSGCGTDNCYVSPRYQ